MRMFQVVHTGMLRERLVRREYLEPLRALNYFKEKEREH